MQLSLLVFSRLEYVGQLGPILYRYMSTNLYVHPKTVWRHEQEVENNNASTRCPRSRKNARRVGCQEKSHSTTSIVCTQGTLTFPIKEMLVIAFTNFQTNFQCFFPTRGIYYFLYVNVCQQHRGHSFTS